MTDFRFSPRPGFRCAAGFRPPVLAVVAATWMLVTGGVAAEELVVELHGNLSGVTEEIEIEGPWLLDWHVGTDFPGSFGIEIDLVDSVWLNHKGQVLKTRYAGAGTRLFHESGAFRFRITSNLAKWRLRISKLSEEEAAAMVPRQPKK